LSWNALEWWTPRSPWFDRYNNREIDRGSGEELQQRSVYQSYALTGKSRTVHKRRKETDKVSLAWHHVLPPQDTDCRGRNRLVAEAE
jgi:hypothetical protein